MDKISLLLCFGALLLLALPMLFFPLRQLKHWLFLFIASTTLAVHLAYQHWGGWETWQKIVQNHQSQKHIQHLLKSSAGAEKVINNLKERLDDNPNDAQGWYLLGRLYASQEHWVLAEKAYKEAYQLKPEDETITVSYIQSLWEINKQQCNERIRSLFKEVLQKNPNQADSLAILAIDAYQNADYQTALDYWRHLLQLLPSQSEEVEVITKAILETKKHLISR